MIFLLLASFSSLSQRKEQKNYLKLVFFRISILFGTLILLSGCVSRSTDTFTSSPIYQQALDICSQEADATLTTQNPMLNVSATQQQQNFPGTVGRLRTFSYASLSFQSQRNKLINACLQQKGLPPQSW